MLLPYCILVRVKSLLPQDQTIPSDIHCTEYWGSVINTIIPNTVLQAVIAIIMIFLQAALINHIVNKHRMTSVATLFPGMIYILLCSVFVENLHLTQYTFGNTFCLIAMMNFLDIYKKHKPELKLFRSGFWLSFAFVCSPIYGFLLIPTIASFILLRTFNIKELLQVLIGTATSLFLFFTVHYLIGTIGYSDAYFAEHFTGMQLSDNPYVIGFLGIMGLTILIVILSSSRFQQKQSLPVRKKISAMYVMLLSTVGIIIANCHLNLNIFYYLWIPMSYFISMLIIDSRKLLIAEILHVIFFISILNNHFNFFTLF